MGSVKKLRHSYPGITFTICIGKYGGFYIRKADEAYGICLGWIAFTCYLFDQEEALAVLLDMREDGTQKQS